MEEVEYWTTNYLITHYLPQAQGPGRSVVRVGRSLGRRIGCPEGHCDTRSRIMQDRILSIGGRPVDPPPLEIQQSFVNFFLFPILINRHLSFSIFRRNGTSLLTFENRSPRKFDSRKNQRFS